MLINKIDSIPYDSLLVFLHVTKTGGVSFDKVLRDAFGPDYFRESQTFSKYIKDLQPAEKKNIRAISGHFRYGVHTINNKLPLYVTCVRDPISRIISLYNHIIRKDKHPLHKVAIDDGMDKFCLDFSLCKHTPFYNQCQIICNEDSFEKASLFLETFLLYCEISQLDCMQQLLFQLVTGENSNKVYKLNTNSISATEYNLSDNVVDRLTNLYENDIKLVELVRTRFEYEFAKLNYSNVKY